MAEQYEATMYSMAQRDKSGFLLGLNMSQSLGAFGSIFLGVVFRMAGASFWYGVAVALFFSLFTFSRYRGRYWSEWVMTVFRWIWVRRLPLWWTETPWNGEEGDVPPTLVGLRIEDHTLDQQRVGVIWDDKEYTAAAIVRLRGRDFDVLSAAEQDVRLRDFGRALGFSAGEGSPVVRVSWTQRAFRQSLSEHREFVSSEGRNLNRALRRHYLDIVNTVGNATVRHEAFFTVVVSQQRAGISRQDVYGRSNSRSRTARIVASLDKELRSLELHMQEAGIAIENRLSKADIAEMMQEALDPTKALGLAVRTGRLEQKVLRDPRCGPIQTELRWGAYAIDGGVHRSFRITEWPRTPVFAHWMPRMLARTSAARTMSVVFEPIPPAKSATDIQRQLTKLDTDERLAHEFKRRVKSSTHRARASVLQRDEELAAGFPEMRYYGVVTISAPDQDSLVRACEEFESSAGTGGLVVAPCDGEHDLGWTGSLPLCRGSVKALGA